MRPLDPADAEVPPRSLFELWMGMTPVEWDMLGEPEGDREHE